MPYVPRKALESMIDDLQFRLLQLQEENERLYLLLEGYELDDRQTQARRMLQTYQEDSQREDLPDVIPLNLDLH